MIERLDGWTAIHPGWRDRLRAACRDGGYSLRSVWRSYELQARWNWCYQNGCPPGRGCHGSPGACPGANAAGDSNHEWAELVPAELRGGLEAAGLVVADERPGGLLVPASLAADLRDDRGDDFAWLHARLGYYHLVAPIARERWHFQPAELPASYQTGSPFAAVAAWVTHLPAPDPWAELFVPVLT